MANPIFGADSLLDDSTVTNTPSPSADTDFPFSNINDDRVFTVYKMGVSAGTLTVTSDAGVGNTRVVDYFMLIGHDLSDPASDGLGATLLEFQNSLDGISYSTIFSVTPSDDKIIARFFAEVTDRFFRIRVTRGASFIASLGQLQYGKAVVVPFGMSVPFDPNAEVINVRRNVSQSGNVLGSTENFTERIVEFAMILLPSSFVDGTALGEFRSFWDDHASTMKPFLFHWNPGNPGTFEKDAIFGTINPGSGVDRTLTTQLATGLRNLQLSMRALKE